MSALDDLREHPVPANPWDYRNPDARSLHEVSCDLARQAAEHPELCADLPSGIMSALMEINAAVAKIADHLTLEI